eukprot:3908573-Rhodomonas_salina.1
MGMQDLKEDILSPLDVLEQRKQLDRVQEAHNIASVACHELSNLPSERVAPPRCLVTCPANGVSCHQPREMRFRPNPNSTVVVVGLGVSAHVTKTILAWIAECISKAPERRKNHDFRCFRQKVKEECRADERAKRAETMEERNKFEAMKSKIKDDRSARAVHLEQIIAGCCSRGCSCCCHGNKGI